MRPRLRWRRDLRAGPVPLPRWRDALRGALRRLVSKRSPLRRLWERLRGERALREWRVCAGVQGRPIALRRRVRRRDGRRSQLRRVRPPVRRLTGVRRGAMSDHVLRRRDRRLRQRRGEWLRDRALHEREALRRVWPRVSVGSGLRGRSLRLPHGVLRVRRTVTLLRAPRRRSQELRSLRRGVRVDHVLRRWEMRLPARRYVLPRPLHGPPDQRSRLRRLRTRVSLWRGLQSRRLRVSRRRDGLPGGDRVLRRSALEARFVRCVRATMPIRSGLR